MTADRDRGADTPPDAPAESTAAPSPAVRHYIERLGLLLIETGFPPMPARVWAAAITANAETVTPSDLAARLGVSPAAISGALRYLVQVRLMERVAVPGSRRQHYGAPVHLWYDTFESRQGEMRAYAEMARAGATTLGGDSPAGQRMAELSEFFDFVAAELPAMMQRWHSSRNAD